MLLLSDMARAAPKQKIKNGHAGEGPSVHAIDARSSSKRESITTFPPESKED